MEQVERKSLKPSPGCLFETIKGLMQFANISRISCIHITKKLLHVNLLLEVTMEKGIRDIKLSQRLIAIDSNGKNQFDCSWLDHWTESLQIVNTNLLMKYLGYKSSFVTSNSLITVKFDLEHLFTTNQISMRRYRDQ